MPQGVLGEGPGPHGSGTPLVADDSEPSSSESTRHPSTADAIARSFLGKLPADLVERLTAEEQLADYPRGAVFYREGTLRVRAGRKWLLERR